MTPNPILKVLSSIREHGVQGLLIGGQACVLYGAAEFSRDLDLVILLSPANLDRLHSLLSRLEGEVVAVPPFAPDYLERGHFVHFRCGRSDVVGVRVDVATRLRGVPPFPELWERRQTFALPDVGPVDVMGLSDLVASKKTQRDKDWVMLLEEAAARHPAAAHEWRGRRPLLASAMSGDRGELERGLVAEMERERDANRAYWAPLRRELAELRRERPNRG